MTKSTILTIAAVTKRFPQTATPAVNQITLTLFQGELFGLLGESGCGKTTLLRLIAGFEQPDQGTIVLNGQTVGSPTSSLPPEERQIGMVFQDFALFPHLTVAQNIAFGLNQRRNGHRYPNSQIKQRIYEAFDLVRLSGLENRYPHQLSGGQQQRVALARALAPRPNLILLDEPFSNLDVQVRQELRGEVRAILQQTGISGVLVTHDQEEALSLTDRLGVMRQGRLEQVGSPEEIYQKPASQFIARFVTQANFLPAKRKGSVWMTELGEFPSMGSPLADGYERDTGNLMLRQEDLVLKPSRDSETVVCDRQFLGREYRYRLKTGSGLELYAKVSVIDKTVLPVGSHVEIATHASQFQVFQEA